MQLVNWKGVFPAITTPFTSALAVDSDALSKHVRWLVNAGCTGIVALGSLGEVATLTFNEKVGVLRTCKAALAGRVPLVAGISGLSTDEAVGLAKAAAKEGCDGLMVLPPYVYNGDWREMSTHFDAVFKSTPLSSMLYNNPIAYKTDVLPEQYLELVDRNPNLHAIKESSGDIRRVSAVRALLADRAAIFAGLDDAVVECVYVGAIGWIAGLVNAYPAESVRLLDLARSGRHDETRRLYEWFLPLLRLDTGPKFVQAIKLVQQETGHGSERVRPPRLVLEGAERAAVQEAVREATAHPPQKEQKEQRK